MTETLSDELWMQILSFVPPLELLQSATRVNQYLCGLVQSDPFWKSLSKGLLKKKKKNSEQDEEVLPQCLNVHQIQRICMYKAVATATDDRFPLCLEFGSLFVTRQEAIHFRDLELRRGEGRRVCLASSSHHNFEMLENTLELGIQNWWCSRPCESPESNETLLFTTKCPMALLSKLVILPMVYPYSEDRVFTWRETEIKAYRFPLGTLFRNPLERMFSTNGYFATEANHSREASVPCSVSAPRVAFTEDVLFRGMRLVDSQREHESLNSILQDQQHAALVYDSGKIPVQHRSYPVGGGAPIRALSESFELPDVVANAVAITLIGKDLQEPGTNDYYVGVQNVQLEGIPLKSHP